MEIIVTIVIIVLLVLLIVWLHYRLTYWSRQGIPNAINTIYNRLSKPVHFADLDAYNKHGRIIGVYDGFRPCLMIGDPELIKKVLVTEFDNFKNHRFYHEKQIAGRSLLSLENDQWKRTRKLMSPLFASNNLRKMKPLIEDCSSMLVDNLNKRLETNQIVDMKYLFGTFSLDVLASTVFGIRNLDSFNSQTDEMVLIVGQFLGQHLSIKSLILLWFPNLIKLFNGYVFDYKILNYLNSLVQKMLHRIRTIKAKTRLPSADHQSQQSTTIKDFLTLLDESHIQLTDKQLDNQIRERIIIDNGILFIIAGYDTTSTSLSSIIYCLSLFPDHQQLIVDEIESLRRQLNRNELTLEEINSLDYLNGCILEALRCFPPVSRIERRVNRNCTLGTIKLLKDSLVIIPCYAINHDPEFYPNPSIYDPTRFINKNGNNQQSNLIADTNIFLPFAAGPRNCIGMRFALVEIKICLIYLLTKYQFRPTFDTKIPLDYFTGMPVSAPKEVKVMVTLRR
ncbi:cytochrome P450 3A8-like isoform X2 [Panonychus citri]|uniref:cytochrome P450 3A8-like isoform X2 n=1 Tax=Panonychus citri TaxID=50023 RepID=UPI002307D8C9|nr:cytochrome P450 3A8-like isoform X2 [Panonychus citri]